MIIRKKQSMTVAAIALLAMATVAAAAEPATVLTIEENSEQAASAPASIEVSSWSWGASNPGMAKSSGMGAGKVNVQDLSRAAQSPRDAASGLATGKRQHKPITVTKPMEVGAAAQTLGAPKIGEATTLVAEIQESATVANSALARACASGKHIAKATLTARGQTTEMKEVVVSSCAVTDNVRRFELTGHVTLIR
jgi:type VI protein secretion system component Hcp